MHCRPLTALVSTADMGEEYIVEEEWTGSVTELRSDAKETNEMLKHVTKPLLVLFHVPLPGCLVESVD